MSAEPTDIRPRKMLPLAEECLEASLDVDITNEKAQVLALQSIAASLLVIARSEAQR